MEVESKSIALLIDSENISPKYIELIIDEANKYGKINYRRVYGDWTTPQLNPWKNKINEFGLTPVQQYSYTSGKNVSDFTLIIDAMDILYSGKVNSFCIVSSDSDFTKLASRLREDEIYVFGFGEHKTPTSFRNACDDFLLTENLSVDEGEEAPGKPGSTKPEKPVKQSKQTEEVPEIVKLLRRAYDHVQDDQGWAHLSATASFLKRAKSDFDPRSYGAKKFSDLFANLGDYFELRKQSGTNGIMAYRPIRDGKK
jgi:uncharacterized LabA/DUF88 family protein